MDVELEDIHLQHLLSHNSLAECFTKKNNTKHFHDHAANYYSREYKSRWSKVLLSTILILLLLVPSYIGKPMNQASEAHLDNPAAYNNVNMLARHLTSQKNDHHRSTRAWTPFQKTWRSILRNTLGYTSARNLNGPKASVFVKVGTMDSALADFESLKPTNVAQLACGKISGRVGNRDVTLRKSFDRVILGLGDNTKTRLRVIYFEKSADANAFVDRMANYKFRNC